MGPVWRQPSDRLDRSHRPHVASVRNPHAGEGVLEGGKKAYFEALANPDAAAPAGGPNRVRSTMSSVNRKPLITFPMPSLQPTYKEDPHHPHLIGSP